MDRVRNSNGKGFSRLALSILTSLRGAGVNLFNTVSSDPSASSCMTLALRDSQFHGGRIGLGVPDTTQFSGSGVGSLAWTNNLFERVYINLNPGTALDLPVYAYNNLFWHGVLCMTPTQTNWVFRDNLFDQVPFAISSTPSIDCDYNAYRQATDSQLTSAAANSGWAASFQSLPPASGKNSASFTTALAYQTSFFGNYYLPVDAITHSRGSQSPTAADLYYYTTCTNQVPEGTKVKVDIGLHYVATYSNGNPLDSNSDGIPDYELSIVVQPQSCTTNLGQSATFSVTATGTGTLTYQWQKDGVNIPGANQSQYIVNPVSSASRGTYRVIVSNQSYDTIISSNANLGLNWYVAPDDNGLTTGDGTQRAPWDLKYALEQQSDKIGPGDTVWLHGGVYHHKGRYEGSQAFDFSDKTMQTQAVPTTIFPHLLGSPGAPIVIRALPGESVTIDGAFQLSPWGDFSPSYLRFQDMEVAMLSYTNRYAGVYYDTWGQLQIDNNQNQTYNVDRSGFNVCEGNLGIEIVNCVVHDCCNGGLGGCFALCYGCVIYNNGFYYNDPDPRHNPSARGYGFYVQSKNPSAEVRIQNTVCCDNAKGGFQVNSATGADVLRNVHVDHLISYQNGHLAGIQANSKADDEAGVDMEIAYDSCSAFYNYYTINSHFWNGGQENAETYDHLDPSASPVADSFIFTNNIVVCGNGVTGHQANFDCRLPTQNVVLRNNRFYGGDFPCSKNIMPALFPNNCYSFSQPVAGVEAYVYTNAYEVARATIVIYNWSGGIGGPVNVLIDNIGLRDEDTFELHQCQDYYGDKVRGIYHYGVPIQIDLTSGNVAQPVGVNFHKAPSSLPRFGVFVIRKASQ